MKERIFTIRYDNLGMLANNVNEIYTTGFTDQ